MNWAFFFATSTSTSFLSLLSEHVFIMFLHKCAFGFFSFFFLSISRRTQAPSASLHVSSDARDCSKVEEKKQEGGSRTGRREETGRRRKKIIILFLGEQERKRGKKREKERKRERGRRAPSLLPPPSSLPLLFSQVDARRRPNCEAQIFLSTVADTHVWLIWPVPKSSGCRRRRRA